MINFIILLKIKIKMVIIKFMFKNKSYKLIRNIVSQTLLFDQIFVSLSKN